MSGPLGGHGPRCWEAAYLRAALVLGWWSGDVDKTSLAGRLLSSGRQTCTCAVAHAYPGRAGVRS